MNSAVNRKLGRDELLKRIGDAFFIHPSKNRYRHIYDDFLDVANEKILREVSFNTFDVLFNKTKRQNDLKFYIYRFLEKEERKNYDT